MAPQELFDDEHHQYNNADQWALTCVQCFKTISSSRPPTFNPENWHYCSCPSSSASPSPPPFSQQGCHPVRRAESCASSDVSVSCPDGPEREDPNVSNGNLGTGGMGGGGGRFLPLAPVTGLGEAQHRRTASFRSEMSYQMQRYLVDQAKERRSWTDGAVVDEGSFISQEVFVLSQSKREGKGNKRSGGSGRSGSEDSGDGVEWGGGGGLLGGMGGWDDSPGEEGYPMTMSGMTGSSGEEK